jgi:hypothetical protein
MDLKEFVAGSLTQIAEGIKQAQEASTKSGAWINPLSGQIPASPERPIVHVPNGRRYLHEVKFDVAVTVSDEQRADAGAGIQIFGAKLGAEGELKYQNAAVSRVQFSVPVIWPGDEKPELDKAMDERRSATMDALIADSASGQRYR